MKGILKLPRKKEEPPKQETQALEVVSKVPEDLVPDKPTTLMSFDYDVILTDHMKGIAIDTNIENTIGSIAINSMNDMAACLPFAIQNNNNVALEIARRTVIEDQNVLRNIPVDIMQNNVYNALMVLFCNLNANIRIEGQDNLFSESDFRKIYFCPITDFCLKNVELYNASSNNGINISDYYAAYVNSIGNDVYTYLRRKIAYIAATCKIEEKYLIDMVQFVNSEFASFMRTANSAAAHCGNNIVATMPYLEKSDSILRDIYDVQRQNLTKKDVSD